MIITTAPSIPIGIKPISALHNDTPPITCQDSSPITFTFSVPLPKPNSSSLGGLNRPG